MMKSYKVKQIMERHSVSQNTVLQWIATGQLKAINVGRRANGKPRWRIPAQALEAFELARTPTPPQRRKTKPVSRDVIEFYQ